MRRVLKKIANDETDLGDISTMADSTVVEVSAVLFYVCQDWVRLGLPPPQ